MPAARLTSENAIVYIRQGGYVHDMESDPDGSGTRGEVSGQEVRSLAEELYRERVVAARKMSPEEKLLAGEELFNYACSITLAGIRNQFSEAGEEECRRILRERLALRERMEKQSD